MIHLETDRPILLTGASGYMASWITHYLLEQGHTVHGTVRDPHDVYKVGHLDILDRKHPGKLVLFKADLLDDGSFAAAMQGCEIVIHTASPFKIRTRNPQAELIDPALRGTRNVLQSANEIDTVQRVVLTSSVAAVMGDAREVEDTTDGVLTEDNWNLSSDLRNQPFSYSKTVAEKEAWRMNQEQNRWHLVALNPAFMLGPSISSRLDGTSTTFVRNLVNGSFRSGLPDLTYGIVDVRDVARAHLLAAALPNARGRHILCAETCKMIELGDQIKSFLGSKYPVPRRQMAHWWTYLMAPFHGYYSWRFLRDNLGYTYELDSSYSVEDLHMEYRPVLETLVDQVKDLEERGLI
jgi:nucleoside-diphosphate-sugar epimerase